MKKLRFGTEQVIAMLHERAAGVELADLVRRHRISPQRFYSWRRRYGYLQVSEAKCLKALEKEHARLKRLVADQALNTELLQGVLGIGS